MSEDALLSRHLVNHAIGMSMTVMVSLTPERKYKIHAVDDTGKEFGFGITGSASIANSQFDLGVRQFKAMGYKIIEMD